jgi:iron complex outermembrane receptor protein
MRRALHHCFSLSLIAALAARTAGAQATRDSVGRDSVVQRVQAVSVTESRAVGVTAGASAVVMRVGELRSSPAPLLDQALRESPFVLVRQNSRGEMELSVRGSDSRQAAVILDGVPITLGWDHRTDPSLIPLTGSQNMVIVRGLGSVLNGPNTLGGTIEISQDGRATESSAGRVWGGLGVDQTSAFVASIGGARKLASLFGGSLSAQAGVATRDRAGVRLPGGTTDTSARDGLRTNSDLQHTDGFAAVRWNGVQGRALGVSMSAFNAERGVPPEEHIASPRLWRYPYHSRALAALSASTGAFSTPFGIGTFDVGVGYNTGRYKIETFRTRRYDVVTSEELGDERTLTGRALAMHSLPRGATIKASITAADVRYEETLSPAAGVDYRQTLFSTAAEVEAPVGGKTKLSAGLVFDNTSTPKTGGRTPGQEPFSDLGWRAGITHALNPAWRLHASASQRSRFPALRELYSGAQDRFLPNPELDPETLLGLEAGVTSSGAFGAAGTATFGLTGFHHDLDDAVVRITLPAPDRRFRRINRDRVESRGAELLGGLTFGAVPQRAVTLNGDLMLQNVTIVDVTRAGAPARHSENNPEQRGTIELGVPVPLDARLFATARYTGTQYCLNPDTGNELTLASQTRADIALERNFPSLGRGVFRALRALVSVDNVGNATVYDQCGLPQPGRTVRLMLTLR